MKIQAAMYRSALKFLIIAVALSLFASPSYAAYSQDSNAEFDSLANEFFKLIKNNEFKKITELFHYPADYTEQKLEEDRRGLRVTLEFVQKEFGVPSNHHLYEKEVETYNFSLNSGNPSYWEKYSGYVSKRYKVAFDTSGEGFITIVFCRIQDKLEIKTIKYEKEASEEARKFILHVIDKFREEIVPQIQPPMLKVSQPQI